MHRGVLPLTRLFLLLSAVVVPSADCASLCKREPSFVRDAIISKSPSRVLQQIRGGGETPFTSQEESTTFHPPSAPIAATSSFAQHAVLSSPKQPTFRSATYVAIANLLLFALRPEQSLHWFTRVPRLLWEVALLTTLTMASHLVAPPLYLLVMTMALSTALVDIFFWAPIYAFFTSFETCTTDGSPLFHFFLGNSEATMRCEQHLTKGFSRGAVAIQAIVGGLVYWGAAMDAWGAYVACRDEQKTQRMRREWQLQQTQQELYWQQQQQQQQPPSISGKKQSQ